MGEEVLSKLIKFVEMASPQVWAMAQRQVQICILQSIFWGILCIVATVCLARVAKDRWVAFKEDKYSMNDFWAGLSVILAVCTGFTATSLCNNLIALVINPQYHAVKELLSLVK